MTLSTRRTIGYTAYFALVAPPIGGFLTWVLTFAPHAIVKSMQNGWDEKAWVSHMKLLSLYIGYSYMLGFFTAAITGAIYGAFISEKTPKKQYITSFVAAITVQTTFMQVFVGNVIWDNATGQTTIVILAAGVSAATLIATKNIYKTLATPSIKCPTPHSSGTG